MGLKSPSTRAAMKSADPKMHHWATVKRDLMFGEDMVNCPLCNYPAKKDKNGKGRLQLFNFRNGVGFELVLCKMQHFPPILLALT